MHAAAPQVTCVGVRQTIGRVMLELQRARDRPGADWFHEGYRAPLRGGGA